MANQETSRSRRGSACGRNQQVFPVERREDDKDLAALSAAVVEVAASRDCDDIARRTGDHLVLGTLRVKRQSDLSVDDVDDLFVVDGETAGRTVLVPRHEGRAHDLEGSALVAVSGMGSLVGGD